MEKTGKLLNYMTTGVLALAAFAFSSCKDENNETPEGPTATAPSAVTAVQVETGSDVTFNVTVPGGYKSSTVSSTGGTAAIKSEPSAGAASGNVVVTFTAGAAEGAGSLVLTVTDKNNKTTTAAAVIDMAGSYLEGVHFDKTNPAAVFKGNYFARIGAAVSGTVKKATTGNAGGDIDLTNFDADNFNTTGDQAAVDQSAVIAGLGATSVSVDAPLSLLASASSLLTGAATVPAPLMQVDYIGAFDATNDWTAEEWVDFDPNGTAY